MIAAMSTFIILLERYATFEEINRIKAAFTLALFPRLGLPSTLIPHENRAFRKRSSNRRNFKRPAFHFRVDRKHFKNGAFRKIVITMISLNEFSSKTNPKLMTGNCCDLKFFQRSVAEKHLMRFQN